MKDDRVYLRHILRCISRIQDYAAGGRQQFFDSPLIQDGVLRTIGMSAPVRVLAPGRGSGAGTRCDGGRAGGAYAEVLDDGEVAVGDEVEWAT